MVTATCKQCLNTYVVHPYRASTTKFCSRSCASKSSIRTMATQTRHAAKARRIVLRQPHDHRLIALGGNKFTLVSIDDFEWLNEYNWWYTNKGYVRTEMSGQGIQMHRAIMQKLLGVKLEPKELVDHQDGNPLNNLRSNIRLAANRQNSRNSRPHHDGVSKYKGVSWSTAANKWVGRITLDGNLFHLGCFAVEIDAAIAYDAAAIQLFDDYAWLNIIGR